MSSTTTNFSSAVYLANDAEPTPKEEGPVEKPADETKATWQPGGYTPTRASWHSVSGKVKRIFA